MGRSQGFFLRVQTDAGSTTNSKVCHARARLSIMHNCKNKFTDEWEMREMRKIRRIILVQISFLSNDHTLAS